MTIIELSTTGAFLITHNGHSMMFPVSLSGAQLMAQTLTGIAMSNNKLNESGAPSQWLINDLVKKWEDNRPKYEEPDFMKDIDL